MNPYLGLVEVINSSLESSKLRFGTGFAINNQLADSSHYSFDLKSLNKFWDSVSAGEKVEVLGTHRFFFHVSSMQISRSAKPFDISLL
jgi:hypothetical protein